MSYWDVDPQTLEKIRRSSDPNQSLEKWRENILDECSSIMPQAIQDPDDMLNVMRDLADRTEEMLQKKVSQGGPLSPQDKALMDLTRETLQYFHIKNTLDL